MGAADGPVQVSADASRGGLALGALAGRRVRLSVFTFDLVAGPVLFVEGESRSVMATPTGSRIVRESGGDVRPRAHLGLRLNVGARSHLRGFVGLNTELGSADEQPMWNLGAVLGITVGTL